MWDDATGLSKCRQGGVWQQRSAQKRILAVTSVGASVSGVVISIAAIENILNSFYLL
jgi:hypothetical protein